MRVSVCGVYQYAACVSEQCVCQGVSNVRIWCVAYVALCGVCQCVTGAYMCGVCQCIAMMTSLVNIVVLKLMSLDISCTCRRISYFQL